MDKFYPPYFPCYIPLPNGKPAAGGKLYAYYTGTDNLAPLYAEDGTILVGSVADIDSSGQVHVLLDPAITYRLKVVPPVGSQMPDQIYDNVRVANGTIVGMENPMTAEGDLIVGGAGGQPERLAPGDEGDALQIVSGKPAWTAPIESGKVRVAQSSPLKYVGDAILTGVGLGSVASYMDGTVTISIDADGVAAGNVLTADGNDGCNWAAIPTQPGDHKTAVDGADASPDYLAAKLAAGTGISLTNTGSAVEIAATAQSGDHQLLVSATDAAAGYLGAKLTAGSNVTLTPHTDGDGVQTLEIAATGGGGGGGVNTFVKWTQEFVGATGTTSMSTTQSIVLKCYADTDIIPEEVVLPCDHQYANTTYKAFIVVGTETFSSSTVSFSGSVTITTPSTTPPRVAHIPLTGKNGFTKIEEGKTYFIVFGKSSGGTSEYFKQDYGVTLYHARTYAGAITETPNWVWNNATAQTGLPIVGLKFKRA